ncbi:TPA: hypothetical protein RVS02_004412 [Aeromonas veronii]|nr:hypothetical protein [Aeromonas veronii]
MLNQLIADQSLVLNAFAKHFPLALFFAAEENTLLGRQWKGSVPITC